jgi:hypothetical protein
VLDDARVVHESLSGLMARLEGRRAVVV